MEDRPGYLVDLYSMVHVADKTYYEELENRFSDYDYVLVELITSVENIVVAENCLSKLKTRVFSPQASNLGKNAIGVHIL